MPSVVQTKLSSCPIGLHGPAALEHPPSLTLQNSPASALHGLTITVCQTLPNKTHVDNISHV